MYIAIAQHNANYRIVGSVICGSDDDPRCVLAAAKHAEELGYEFFENGTGVQVLMIGNGELIPKDGSKYEGDQPPPESPILFTRTKQGGQWVERWFDQDLKEQFAGDPLDMDPE